MSLTAPADENKETTINQFALQMISQSMPHNRELNSFISSIRGTQLTTVKMGMRPLCRRIETIKNNSKKFHQL